MDNQPMIDEIKQRIEANDAKLNACAGPHDFSQPVDRLTREPIPEQKLFCHWACVKCGGVVEVREKIWYKKGLAHALPRTPPAST